MADRRTIEGVLTRNGLEPVSGVPTDVSKVDVDNDIGVVGLPVDPTDETVVDDRTQAFAAAGIRVVGIWLREEEAVGMPEGLADFGSSAVSIGSPSLSDVLKGEGEEAWEGPSGTTRPLQKTPRNKC